MLGLLLVGCAAPQAAAPQVAAPTGVSTAPTSAPAQPAPTAPADAVPTAAAAASDADILASIQQSLDLYAQAYNENKPELLKQAADQTNAPFRRFIQTRFDTFQVRSDRIIPIKDTSGVVNKQDLEHLTILEKDVSLSYGLAVSLVDYIVETHGGMDGWWKLVGAYDKSQNLDKALREAFGIGYDEFDQGWRAWLKQKYG
jgi:hypothetical protein